MSQAITRHFVHFGITHIDGGERKERIVEIAGSKIWSIFSAISGVLIYFIKIA